MKFAGQEERDRKNTWTKNRLKEGYKVVECPFCKQQYFEKDIVGVYICNSSKCKKRRGVK